MIAFVTCAALPDLDSGDRAVAEDLRARGVDVEPLVWTESTRRDFEAIVIRSAWDYHLAPDRFRAWLEGWQHRGVPVCNPVDVVLWNLDKAYLLELEERGVPIVPTACLAQGQPTDLEQLLTDRGWDEAVVKPTVSLSAYRTWRTDTRSAGTRQQDLETMTATGGVLVQRFVPEILTDGEVSLLYFLGNYSHAVRKTPAAGDFRVQSDHGGSVQPFEPNDDVLRQAGAVIAATHQRFPRTGCLYARVDGVVQDGQLLLMEIELIDPELFVRADAQARARLVDAMLTLRDRSWG